MSGEPFAKKQKKQHKMSDMKETSHVPAAEKPDIVEEKSMHDKTDIEAINSFKRPFKQAKNNSNNPFNAVKNLDVKQSVVELNEDDVDFEVVPAELSTMNGRKKSSKVVDDLSRFD